MAQFEPIDIVDVTNPKPKFTPVDIVDVKPRASFIDNFATQMKSIGAEDKDIKLTTDALNYEAAKMAKQGMTDAQIQNAFSKFTWVHSPSGKTASMTPPAPANTAESLDFQPAAKQSSEPTYDPTFGGTLSREAAAGWNAIKEGLFNLPKRPLSGTAQVLGGALQAGFSPVTALGAKGGEVTGETVREATYPYLGPTGSAIAGTAVGAPVNLALQMLAPSLIGRAVSASSPLINGARKSLAEFVAPRTAMQGGVEAAMETLGTTPNSINRSFAPKASEAAFANARAQGPLPVDALVDALSDVARNSGRSVPNRPALRAIKETSENLKPPIVEPQMPNSNNMAEFLANKQKTADDILAQLKSRPTETTYSDAINEVHGLRGLADKAFHRGDTTIGTTLNNAAKALIDTMDSLSPAIKAANQIYRREQAVAKIETIISKPDPRTKFAELLKNDELVRGALTFSEAKQVERFASEIGRMGATASPHAGAPSKFINLIGNRLAHRYDPLASGLESPAMRNLRNAYLEKPVDASGLVGGSQVGVGINNILKYLLPQQN